jgi:hypothetical protein
MLQAQNNCNRPMSDIEYNQRKNQVMAQSAENQKLNRALQIAQSSCFSSAQVKEISMIFAQDESRIRFAQAAYPNVVDKQNFYDVYDAFTKFSMAIRLYEALQQGNNTPATPNPNTNPVNPTQPNDEDFPELSYPAAELYVGRTGCNNFLSAREFSTQAASLRRMPNEQQRYQAALRFVRNGCLTTEQLMKMATLFSSENNRLELLKQGYRRIYDIGNYQLAVQLLTQPRLQNDFNNFLNQQEDPITPVVVNPNPNPVVTPNPTITPTCNVSDADMAGVVKAIKSESFDDKRVTLLRTIATSNRCFTVNQVRTLMRLFSFEKNRLESAKILYDFTIPEERRNYFSLGSELSFAASRTELNNFINEKQK